MAAGTAIRVAGALLKAAGVAFLCVLVGCSSSPSDQGQALRFVTWKPDQPEVWDEAVRRFERAHPDIPVTREVGPHSSTAFHDLVTQKLKNRDPGIDVYFLDVVWLAEFAAAGWTLPLESRFGERQQSEFLEGTIRASTWQGRVNAVPAFIDAGMLYFRKDLLEKYHVPVPTTWSQLDAAARRIVAAERPSQPGLLGYSGQFKQYEGLVCDLLEFVTAKGGRFVDDQATRATLSEPPTIEAIRWVRDQVIGGIAPRSVLTYQEPESLALFLQGLAVFHRNWPYAWDVSNDERQSRVAGKVGIAPLPGFGEGAGRSALGGWLYGISSYSRHADAAWKFVEYMSTTANSEWCEAVGQVPANTEAAKASWVQQSQPLKAIVETSKNPKTQYLQLPTYLPDWGKILKTEMEPDFQKVLQKQLSAQAFADKYAARFEQAKKEYDASLKGGK